MPNNVPQAHKSPRVFSLKWKSLLLLSLLLTIIYIILSTLAYKQLEGGFKRHQKNALTIYSQSLTNSLQQTQLQLRGIAESVSIFHRQQRLDELALIWPDLQRDWKLDSITLIDGQLNTQLQLGEVTSRENNREILERLKRADTNTPVLCEQQCYTYAAVSSQNPKGSLWIVVRSNLKYQLAAFSNNYGIHTALIQRDAQQHRMLSENLSENRSLQQRLQQSGTIDTLLQPGQQPLNNDAQYFNIYSRALPSLSNHKSSALIIHDQTLERQAIDEQVTLLQLIAIGGLMLSECVLLIILWRPMARLKRQAELLPLLGKRAYPQVRKKLRPQNKSLWPDELDILDNSAIELSLQLETLEQEINQRTNELEYMALYDSLTGLANRRLFLDHLSIAIEEHHRNGETFAILFLDLDHFKRINDSLGHDIGDELLIDIARRLNHCVRPTDTVARLGGDEFTILIPHLKRNEDAVTVAHKVLEELRTPIKLGKNKLIVTPSIGIAIAPDNGLDANELMRCADMAMYHAKKEGRNGYHFFTQEMNAQAQKNLQLENRLRQALDDNEFFLHYQPIVDLSCNSTIGYEALVRWQHPEQGLISPLDFIPMMERNGQIIELGVQVIRKVCAELPRLGSQIKVSINLSPRQLNDEQLLEKLDDIFEHSAINTQQIKFEITENTLMDNIEANIRLLSALKHRGFTLAIDDFGTGYSSLNYLKQLPVDELKIDRGFVEDIARDSSDREICSAVIAMAHKLNLKVTAEGIEDHEQLHFLKNNHCDFGQGYLFHKPATIAELQSSEAP